jgi:hypothetical protein
MPRAESSAAEPARALSSVAPLIRFHALGAARLAQRNTLATLALLIVMLAFAPDPARIMSAIGLVMTASQAPRTPALLWMIVAILLARRALPTLHLGFGGWLGSLPLRPADHRRALALALTVPLFPLIAAHAVFAMLTPMLFGEPISLPSLAGSAVGYVAAAAAAVPVRRGTFASPLAALAAFVWILGSWTSTLLALCLVLAWDLVAGAAMPTRRPRPRTRHADRWIAPTLSWRALGWRSISPTIIGAFLLGAAWLFRANNDVPGSQSALVTRLALLSALWLGLQMLSEALFVRRRPWPWHRSLPTTSTRRAIDDAVALGIPALPVVVLAVLLDRGSAVVGLSALPLLAAITVWALRLAPGRILGVIGPESWIGGGLVIGVCTVWPTASIVALLLAPLAIRLAAQVDRNRIVTAWEPLHHDAAGDSMSEVAR